MIKGPLELGLGRAGGVVGGGGAMGAWALGTIGT